MNPQRREDLLIHEDSGILYDPVREQFLAPNDTAARVLSLCDGERSVEELQRLIPRETGLPEGREWTLCCLQALRRRGLLRRRTRLPSGALTRRQALRRLRELGWAAALPTFTVLAAPTPAQAGSLLGTGEICTDPAQCASGLCIGGTCA